MDPQISDFILAFPMLVFAMVAHEYAHAASALRQGDDTAYALGRVTLNPLPHIDPWMSLGLPALLWYVSSGTFIFGGAKPVPVNPRKYRHYRRGDIIVSAAGVVTNLALAVLWALVFVAFGLLAHWLPAASTVLDTAQRMMVHGIRINLILCFFNLIPVPPLDGSHILSHLLPPKAGAWYRGLQQFGVPLLFALMFLMFLFQPVMQILLAPAYGGMRLLLNLILPYHIGQGWDIYA